MAQLMIARGQAGERTSRLGLKKKKRESGAKKKKKDVVTVKRL